MYKNLIMNIINKNKIFRKLDKIINQLDDKKLYLNLQMINGFETYLMNQLVFKFPFKTKYFEQDFYVSSNNFSAYKLVESWPNWSSKWFNIYGTSGSGKTHLSKILEKKLIK